MVKDWSGILNAALLASFATSVVAQQTAWGQCGGIGWTGPTTCVSGYVCNYQNDWYSQCIPGTATTSTTTTTTSRSTTGTPTTTTTGTTTTTTATPTGTWAAALSKASTAVAKLSTQDKVNLATGTGWQRSTCVGNIAAISSISFPGLCLEDGPLGIRFADKISVFPAGVNAAATFNRNLMRQRGVAMGEEFRGKGVNIALGPAMNIARVPAAGRNWEGFGADPYLAGEAAFQTIQGIQSKGVQANAKHYINNEQEHFRETSSSNVDDRTQHEIYLAPFLQAVRAGVATVMCSYNQINGSYACGNSKMLNGVLKTELGFQGPVISDWAAQHSVTDANNGLDQTMPGDGLNGGGGGNNYFGSQLLSAVNSGTISQSRLNDMATRILAAWYLLGQDSGYPATNFHAWNSGSGQHIDVQGNHSVLIRQIAAASTVLLKNTNSVLPLSKPASIAVIGSHAAPNPSGPNACSDRGCNTGVLAQGWGSGTAEFPYLSDPLSAIRTRASSDGSTVTASSSDTDLTAARNAATGKTVAIVFITADSGEGYITVEGNQGDRNNLNAWHSGDALVSAVASVNSKTIVVVNSVGQINMEAWVANANVSAVVLAGLPGQEAGNALVDILYGTVNPSGRLPYTIARNVSDYSAPLVTSGSGTVQIPYTEALNVDYRAFDARNITPRFEFGFGLSYTTFNYSSISVSGKPASTTGPTGAGSSVADSLHAAAVTVTFTLTNTGSRSGTEIPQLYLTYPSSAGSPPYSLRGFEAVSLAAGASSQVSFKLSQYDLSIWNTASQRWTVPTGTFGIAVGASSRDRRLTASLTI